MFLLAAALLVLANFSFGQGISVIWYYLPEEMGGGPALTSGPLCGQGQPLPDGTWIEIRWDQNGNGQDPTDPLPPLCNNPPNCADGPTGTFNRQGFAMNGAGQGLGAGWFAQEGAFNSVGALPNPSRFYLVVRCPDGTVHYQSSVATPGVGANEYFLTGGDWGCFPCVPSCNPTQEAVIVTDEGSNEWETHQSVCIDLCLGSTTIIKICRPGGGPGGFDPAKPPVATVVPGCDPLTTECDRECNAATLFGYDPLGWFIGPDGCWTNVVVGLSDGCACFTFEYFLAASIQSFTGVAGDGEVNLSWVTASETNVSSYAVVRNGEVIANVPSENSVTTHTYVYTDVTAENGTSYTYTLRVVNSDNSVTETNLEVNATPSFGAAVVTEYALHQNFPNPFNPSTSLAFDVVEKNHVTLKVYNAAGQEVSTLANGEFDSGRHIVSFDAGNLPTGLYFYTVKIGNEFTATKKMLLVK
jgi:hypothetical protein